MGERYTRGMATVYLETSFISACVSNRTDAASVYRCDLSLKWWQMQRQSHTLLTSSEVLAELRDPDFQRREEALELIDGIPVLQSNPEVLGVAAICVKQKVMPGDSVHVALACVFGLDYMLTWNVRHLANPNKLAHLHTICRRLGLLPPQIVTPDLLWEQP